MLTDAKIRSLTPKPKKFRAGDSPDANERLACPITRDFSIDYVDTRCSRPPFEPILGAVFGP